MLLVLTWTKVAFVQLPEIGPLGMEGRVVAPKNALEYSTRRRVRWIRTDFAHAAIEIVVGIVKPGKDGGGIRRSARDIVGWIVRVNYR